MFDPRLKKEKERERRRRERESIWRVSRDISSVSGSIQTN
jgi:hypothetical protein